MLLLHDSPHSLPEHLEIMIVVAFVVILALFALLCHGVGGYARRHGRNYLGAVLLSLLFTPCIGFIVVALLCHCQWFRKD